MSAWIEEQFINRLGYKLNRFTRLNAKLYQCRCPICGDSKKRDDLCRGFFIYGDGSWYFHCHNCGAHHNIYILLSLLDQSLWDEYKLELYKEKYGRSPKPVTKTPEPLVVPKSRLPEGFSLETKTLELVKGCTSLSELVETHPAYQYIKKRKIPDRAFPRLFYVSKFRKWVSETLSTQYDDRFPDHPRLVIPYRWTDGSIFRYSSRAFGKEIPRYQQTIIDDTRPRVFGLDLLDPKKRSYVMEGQLDSLFLPNALAVGSASYGIPILNTLSDPIYVPDNQPRNRDVVRQFKKIVDSGKKVCIWKENYGKDINQMVINHNFSSDDLVSLIDESTCQGVDAQLKFNKWCKC